MSLFCLVVLGLDEEQDIDLRQISVELTRLAIDYGYGTSVGGGKIPNYFSRGDPLHSILEKVESSEKHRTIAFDLRTSPIDNTGDFILDSLTEIAMEQGKDVDHSPISPKDAPFFEFLQRLWDLPYVVSINFILFWAGDHHNYEKHEVTFENLIQIFCSPLQIRFKDVSWHWYHVTK